MNILVLNCGSSTVKFQLIATGPGAIRSDEDRRLARGTVEGLGGDAVLTLQPGDREPGKSTAALHDIRSVLDHIVQG